MAVLRARHRTTAALSYSDGLVALHRRATRCLLPLRQAGSTRFDNRQANASTDVLNRERGQPTLAAFCNVACKKPKRRGSTRGAEEHPNSFANILDGPANGPPNAIGELSYTAAPARVR